MSDQVCIQLLPTLIRSSNHFLPILTTWTSHILGELEPFLAAVGSNPAHDPVALRAIADFPAAFLGCPAHQLIVIPDVNQRVRVGSGDRLERLKLTDRHVDLVLKGHTFRRQTAFWRYSCASRGRR
jgi:hypothetical protein